MWKKTNANLAGLLTLPCRIGEFSCVPPHNEEEKPLGSHQLSTTSTKLLSTIFGKWLYGKTPKHAGSPGVTLCSCWMRPFVRRSGRSGRSGLAFVEGGWIWPMIYGGFMVSHMVIFRQFYLFLFYQFMVGDQITINSFASWRKGAEGSKKYGQLKWYDIERLQKSFIFFWEMWLDPGWNMIFGNQTWQLQIPCK